MRYDLDHPPVVIRTARWKMVLLLLVCASFAIIGLFMVRDPQDTWKGYFVATFFGLGIVIALWRLIVPARLELSPGGLHWYTGRKIQHYLWQDFLEFRVYTPTAFTRHVGYVLVDRSDKHTKASMASRRLFGLDGGFGGSWAIRTSELVRLLNSAVEKWGGNPEISVAKPAVG